MRHAVKNKTRKSPSENRLIRAMQDELVAGRKLTHRDVLAIQALDELGYSQVEINGKFPQVSRGTIYHAVHQITWPWLKLFKAKQKRKK